jgi:hypothetical protein
VPILNQWTGTEAEERGEKRESIWTVAIRLYDEVVPITARNFRELCIGRNGFGYDGSLIKRIIPSFIIQVGGFALEGGMDMGGQLVFGHNSKGVFIACSTVFRLKAGWEEKIVIGGMIKRAFCQW